MTLPSLTLQALPQPHSICRLAPDSPLPDWTGTTGCVSITFAPDELSVVCPTARVPEGTEADHGWHAFRVDTLAGLDTPGVVLAMVQPLANAGLGVFVISTYLRDYLLVRASALPAVRASLAQAGHVLEEGTDA